MATRQELLRQAAEFITYQDIFALALATTRLTRLSSDSHKWAAAVYEVWKKFADQIPEFKKISFDERLPLPPQSDEEYELITTLGMSGLISLPNPTFPYIVMTKSQKARIVRDKATLLQNYEALMPSIAQILESTLAP